MHPFRIGLAGIVDYAGLFPPAALDLSRVVSGFEAYAHSDAAWMLGRLVVPLGSLDACAELAVRVAPSTTIHRWTASVLVQGGDALAAVPSAVDAFNERVLGRGIAAVAVEAAAAEPADVDRVAARLPDTLERYVEVAIGPALEPTLDRVADRGCYAKVRTGGLSADRIPSAADLARFVAACHLREVPFKATAGLHHPLRSSYPLTYERESPCATMHGFVNLLAACALLHGGLIEPAQVAAVLEERDPAGFQPETGRLRWRDASVGIAEIADCRAHLFRSVGSCSFEEPVEDLRRLGWMP